MRLRAFGVLVACLPALAQNQPTFYAAWQDGLDAERAGRWQEAAAAYRRALDLHPAPAARVFTYGNNLLRDYYPRTRLAHCLLQLGDLEGAEAVLAAAREEPEPGREALAARLRGLQGGRVKAPPPPAPAPPRPLPPEPATSQPPLLQPAVPPSGPPATQASSEPPAPAAPGPAPRAEPPPEAPVPTLPPVPPAPPVTPPQAQGPRPLPAWLPGLLGLGLALLGALVLWRLRARRPWAWRGRGPAAEPPGPVGTPPLEVGPYRLERLLGRGGFSSTFLARHRDTGVEVALKLPHPHRFDDPEFRHRFRQEAQLGALLDHPNLVRILDPGPEEGTPYLAMAYLPGRTLDERMKAEGALPLEAARSIALEVAQAMTYAHARGVVHRDLKPGNILLTETGARVMDLGIARVMDAATVTTTYAFLGTPLYAAPEAQLKTHVGPAADRYSLGVILFHMLAGVPPFQGETPFEILDRHRSALPPDLRALRPEVPSALARLVTRMLDKEPDQRPEDGEIVNVLAALAPLTAPSGTPGR